MKSFSTIILAAMFAFLLAVGTTEAQVGSDGNLAYTLSNYQAGNSATNGGEALIIRNRLDSGCCWTASADAMIMTRTGGKSDTLMAGIGEVELLNTNDINNFPWITGPRVGIVGEDVFFGCDVEASFFDLQWDSSKVATAPDGGTVLLFDQSLFPYAVLLAPGDIVTYRYLSQLRSAEINLRHPFWERLSVMMGFRYMELHEDLRSTISDSQIFNVNTDNHLYGGQIGMYAAFINTCRFSIEGVMKAGVFGNHSDLLTSVVGVGSYGNKTSHTAFFGEIGLMGIFQVTNHLALRGGYQAMWLDGVAIASDQVENVDFTQTNPKPYIGGSLFYHGAIAGVEYAF